MPSIPWIFFNHISFCPLLLYCLGPFLCNLFFKFPYFFSWKPCVIPSHPWGSNCTATPLMNLPFFCLSTILEDLCDTKTKSNYAMQKDYSPSSAFHVKIHQFIFQCNLQLKGFPLSTSMTAAPGNTLCFFLFTMSQFSLSPLWAFGLLPSLTGWQRQR